MSAELKTWDRPHYTEGGGDPFLFYVVFGRVDTSAPFSQSEYRAAGPADGIEMSVYNAQEHADVLDGFRSGYLWEAFIASNPNLASEVQECDECLVVRGTPSDDTTLNYMRDTVGLLTYMLDQGGIAIFDPLMFQWWNPVEWRQQIFEADEPAPENHVVILVSEEDDPTLKWFHTRGMRKFGRPDISVPAVPTTMEQGVIDLCNRMIEHQALGLVVPEGQEVRMDSLPPGGTMHHAGDLEDPDFNNVHIKITWPEFE